MSRLSVFPDRIPGLRALDRHARGLSVCDPPTSGRAVTAPGAASPRRSTRRRRCLRAASWLSARFRHPRPACANHLQAACTTTCSWTRPTAALVHCRRERGVLSAIRFRRTVLESNQLKRGRVHAPGRRIHDLGWPRPSEQSGSRALECARGLEICTVTPGSGRSSPSRPQRWPRRLARPRHARAPATARAPG